MGTLKSLWEAMRMRKQLNASGAGPPSQSLSPPGMDLEALQAMAAQRGAAPDPAAHMRALAQAGLVMQPCLEPGDPKLSPIDGMSFDVYVALVAGVIEKGSSGELEAAGLALGMAPGTTQSAFEKWGNKVVADQELGTHYTAVLQARLGEGSYAGARWRRAEERHNA